MIVHNHPPRAEAVPSMLARTITLAEERTRTITFGSSPRKTYGIPKGEKGAKVGVLRGRNGRAVYALGVHAACLLLRKKTLVHVFVYGARQNLATKG